MRVIRGERPERWLLFETNQGTDDHILRDDWSLRPWTATSIEGSVVSIPRTRSGGHVLFEVRGRSQVTVATYEPSKQFRDVVRALRPGDRVRVYGSIRDKPRTLNLEKLLVVALAPAVRKMGNPVCPVCGKAMKSMGFHVGFRCLRGHARAPYEERGVSALPRELSPGYYEPPACARRHLAKPLSRLLAARANVVAPRAPFQEVSLDGMMPDSDVRESTHALTVASPEAQAWRSACGRSHTRATPPA
jgi:tRNA(Ile2)-agmatinylcytidine synthase